MTEIAILQFFGEYSGAKTRTMNTVQKVRAFSQRVHQAMESGENVDVWVTFFYKVAGAFRQDTSLFMTDFFTTTKMKGYQLVVDDFDEVIAELTAMDGWVLNGKPAEVGKVESLPYLSGLDPDRAPVRGSSTFSRFVTE